MKAMSANMTQKNATHEVNKNIIRILCRLVPYC